MSSTALYKAFIEAGASEESATKAAEDVIQVSQLPQLATKTDIAEVRTEIAFLRNDMTSQISGVNSRIDSLRNDMTSQISGVNSRIDSLRKDMTSEISGMNSRIDSLRNDMTSEISGMNSGIDSLRNDMTSEIGSLRSDMADRESRLIKWMVSSLFVFTTIIIASIGILFQIMLSPGVAP